MPDLTIGNTNITSLLKEKYQKLGNGWITLLQVPVDNSLKVNLESIKILQSLGYEGIYITLSKSALELSDIFIKYGIKLDKLYFIDAITQMYDSKKLEKNAEYVSGPLNIDAVSSSVYSLLPKLNSKKKFVFLDSITTVLLYNSLGRTLRFSQFLTQTLKRKEVVGIVVSVSKDSTNTKLLQELEKLSDEKIVIEE